MTPTTLRGNRFASAAVLAVGGGAVAAATWVSGNRAWAIATTAVYALAAVAAYLWAGRSGDVAAILRAGGDERQRTMDRNATAITGLAVIVVSLVGAVVSLARTGNPGDFGLVCLVAGVAYSVSLFVLRRRG